MNILRTSGIYILVFSILAVFLPPSSNSYAHESSQSFQAEINQLLQEEPLLKGGLAGISIRSADTGEISYEHNGDIRMRPASNMKLFTSAVIRDGSGISHVNLVPANEISNLLFHVQKEKWFPSFLKSLPVAGKSDRMIGGTPQ